MNDQYITSPEQVHYRDQKLVMRDGYQGRCSKMSPDEVAAMVMEGLNYLGFDDPMALPPPPKGLLGTNSRFHVGAERMVREGVYFLCGVLNKEGRKQHNSYSNIGDALSRQFHDGVEHERQCQSDEITAEAMACTDNIIEMRESQLVYFISNGNGAVKIGVAESPERRLAGLQTGSPFDLSLEATCSGGLEQEKAYHSLFSDHRLRGEWFAAHPDILIEIERLNALSPPHNMEGIL